MRSAVQQYLQAERNSVNLAKLVQFVTLKVSIGYLFKVPEQDLDNKKDVIISIANRINDLWILSKGSGSDGRSIPAWHEEQGIIQDLLTIIPDHDPRDPRRNPMNLILPAYETMWRAVFRATIDVVKEILRLYPPTRRIHRKYPDHEPFISADLEKMHRNRDLAGDDPQAFRPARWLEIQQRFLDDARARTLKEFEEHLGFMPFAGVCPAGNRTTYAFGWKMIALLAGSLIEGLDQLDGGWVLRAGKKGDELPPYGKALGSERVDYLSLVYKKT
ncbi:hypothetical protein KVR01_005759 [Diaporthe batatas]|uniref:uncharacterized protein n=1 Tax=Diaporthe batatas TaxID=748121 RepID=UPI001D05437B|nr:uncharacterized protein KVR01_005759 [Diaporthe batatas]KAG8163841.1 hypothetical protein KVR01_005759 [Diaporthe batatas]